MEAGAQFLWAGQSGGGDLQAAGHRQPALPVRHSLREARRLGDRLTNLNRIVAQEHVTTQEHRHECTNHDELRHLNALQDLDELKALHRADEAEAERRKQLARNIRSLSGRLAHTNRYRRQRDELKEALGIERQTSQALRRELEQPRSGEQLGRGLAE